MKTFLLKISLFVAIQAVILCLVVVAAHRSISTESFFHAMEDKYERLQSLPGERLIIVGGSNVAFGIDSQVISAGTEKHVVNMGLHIGVGLDFYLAMLSECMRKGDTIVFLPEFDMLEGFDEPKVKLDMVRACPRFIPWLYQTRRSQKDFLDNRGFHLAHHWFRTAVRGQLPDPKIYRRNGFNSLGDVVSHYEVGCAIEPGQTDDALGDRNLKRLRSNFSTLVRFQKQCLESGVRLYVSFPPISRQRYDNSRKFLAEYEILLEKNGFQVLGEARDFVYETDQFFDTFYHLGREAAKERSRKLNVALLADLSTESRLAKVNQSTHR